MGLPTLFFCAIGEMGSEKKKYCICPYLERKLKFDDEKWAVEEKNIAYAHFQKEN